jgi:hypothetical protein
VLQLVAPNLRSYNGIDTEFMNLGATRKVKEERCAK